MAVSRILGKFWGKVRVAILPAIVLMALLSTCGACHNGLPKKGAGDATNIGESTVVVKGRILIDPEFSGPERRMIAKALAMWTEPLSDLMRMEISDKDDTVDEFKEMVGLQRMVLEQERAKANAPESEEGEDDPFVDPHDSWDSFDPRTPFWSTAEGCNDRAVVLRVTSDNPRIRIMEMQSKATFVGWTDNGCHKKAILLVIDRIEDEKEFVGVAAHEFGHLFGIKHDFKRRESIMYPGAYSTHCVTDRDVLSFCDRWKCAVRPRKASKRFCE